MNEVELTQLNLIFKNISITFKNPSLHSIKRADRAMSLKN